MKRAMLLLAAQLLCCFLVSLGVFLLKPLGLLHRIAVWGLLPTVAAISAVGLDTHRLNP